MDDIQFSVNFLQSEICAVKGYIGKRGVCRCNVSYKDNTWRITAWYTDNDFQHRGYGTKALKLALSSIFAQTGVPEVIEYVWNGENQYVFDWLVGHFDPVCKLPLEVRKYSDADDWEAHVYTLNKAKVISFCKQAS